ncbi:sensor domain-containing diguanylate cyclase [Rhodoferax sp. 4810]|nr:sensor domain-containing diguanylate cyclase [Thiospirillum jenense]MBB1073826.1 sensor domain-containing diguanylate cyclase [Rhodoferax jenense]
MNLPTDSSISQPVTTVSNDCAQLLADNQWLREQLITLRDCALETEALFKRHQDWEIELLTISTLDQLLECLTTAMCARFTLDEVRLLLLDGDHGIRGLLTRLNKTPDEFISVMFYAAVTELPAPLTQLTTPIVGLMDTDTHRVLFNTAPDLASTAVLPLWREQRLLGFLCFGSHDPMRYSPDLGTHFLQRLAAICAVCLENITNRTRLEIGGLTDPLTGLHNRRALKQRLHDELARSQRLGQPLSCCFVDLDFFKQINDSYGHATGDMVLMELAECLQFSLRACDFAVRFGGDELVVLLPATANNDACLLAERVRHSIVNHTFVLSDGLELSITVSIGVGTIMPSAYPKEKLTDERGDDLLRCADAALYEAKRAGRNRVACQSL